MMKNEHFSLRPMENYQPPAYPTRAAKPRETLRKLPARWAKNAAVVACIGAMSLGLLAGCATESLAAPCDDGNHGVSVTYPYGDNGYAPPDDYYYLPYEDSRCATYLEDGREFDVEVRAHWGGSGAGPFYVAYLTEQEALGIIRNRLCEAGICFDAPVPHYVGIFETEWSAEARATLSLFDERTRQGIVFPAPWWDEFGWGMPHEQIAGALRQDFAERFDVSVLFLRNPGESIGDYDWNWEVENPIFSDEEKQRVAPLLEQELLARVDAFIDQLRREGILPREGVRP